jgi:endonuclease/exonuclease/phosphatase family metal-dependent hydrolase
MFSPNFVFLHTFLNFMAKKSPKKKFRLFRTLLILLNIILALMLLGALFSSKVNPVHNYIPAFLGMAYPVLVYLNLGFVLLWIILRKRWFLVSLVALLVGFNMLGKYFRYNPSRNRAPENVQAYTVLSFNTMSFRTFYYDYSQEYLDSLTGFLSEVKPDIICFQEYYNDLEMEEDIAKQLQRKLNLPEKHINSRLTRLNRYQFGLAILSRFPIIHSGRILNANYEQELSTTNYAIFSDMVIEDDTFRVYNIHLESLRISTEEGIFSSIEDGSAENITRETRKLFSKLRKAFIFRANQLKPIREHMDNSPYPIILCGDFNDSPASWSYAQISSGLQDAFVKAGRGTGKTYTGKYPSFRIDYILMDKMLKIHWFETPKVKFSDHYPVYAVFSVKK